MISPSSQPLVFVVSFNYQIPTFGSNKMVKGVLGGWTVSGIEKYASGFPILSPYSTNGLNSVMMRQTGPTLPSLTVCPANRCSSTASTTPIPSIPARTSS